MKTGGVTGAQMLMRYDPDDKTAFVISVAALALLGSYWVGRVFLRL
jgi:hypothetical protein